MKIVTLDELFVMELKDLYNAEKQVLKVLPKIIKQATSVELRTTLDAHRVEIEGHLKRLERMGEILGMKLAGHSCKAMEGMLEESNELLDECKPGDVLDEAIIGSCQRIEHYKMAAYGCARTHANALGHTQVQVLLQQTLNQDGTASRKLTKMSETRMNETAMR